MDFLKLVVNILVIVAIKCENRENEITDCYDSPKFGSFNGKLAKDANDCFWDFARCTLKCCKTRTSDEQQKSSCCKNRYRQCVLHVTNGSIQNIQNFTEKPNTTPTQIVPSPTTTTSNFSLKTIQTEMKLKYKQCDILKEQETKLLERINALCQLVNCQLDESKKLCPKVCNKPCMVDAYAEYDNCEGSGFQDDPSLPLESDIDSVSDAVSVTTVEPFILLAPKENFPLLNATLESSETISSTLGAPVTTPVVIITSPFEEEESKIEVETNAITIMTQNVVTSSSMEEDSLFQNNSGIISVNEQNEIMLQVEHTSPVTGTNNDIKTTNLEQEITLEEDSGKNLPTPFISSTSTVTTTTTKTKSTTALKTTTATVPDTLINTVTTTASTTLTITTSDTTVTTVIPSTTVRTTTSSIVTDSTSTTEINVEGLIGAFAIDIRRR